jgi:hypothetical protein
MPLRRRNSLLSLPVLKTGTANVNRQWVRNVRKTAGVRLSIGGEEFEGEARFLTERAEHERALMSMRRKYWMYSPLFVVWRILTTIGVVRDTTGTFHVTLVESREATEGSVRSRTKSAHM